MHGIHRIVGIFRRDAQFPTNGFVLPTHKNKLISFMFFFFRFRRNYNTHCTVLHYYDEYLCARVDTQDGISSCHIYFNAILEIFFYFTFYRILLSRSAATTWYKQHAIIHQTRQHELRVREIISAVSRLSWRLAVAHVRQFEINMFKMVGRCSTSIKIF